MGRAADQSVTSMLSVTSVTFRSGALPGHIAACALLTRTRPFTPPAPTPHASREEDVQIVDASDRGDHLASYYADATKGSDRCVLLGWAGVCGEVRSRVSLG